MTTTHTPAPQVSSVSRTPQDEREAFEAWLRKQGLYGVSSGFGVAAWDAWQARATLAATPAAPHPDDLAVDAFAAAMKDKLAKAREKGRGGWQTCPPEELSRMLREHVEKGDPRDVANFAMFLWSLGHGIAAADAVSAEQAAPSEQALPPDLMRAVFAVLEGWTLPHDARKLLETAYWQARAASAQQQAAREVATRQVPLSAEQMHALSGAVGALHDHLERSGAMDSQSALTAYLVYKLRREACMVDCLLPAAERRQLAQFWQDKIDHLEGART